MPLPFPSGAGLANVGAGLAEALLRCTLGVVFRLLEAFEPCGKVGIGIRSTKKSLNSSA